MNNYKYNPINMTPFKWFVLENFPFIEEDFDSLTSYGLWCKLKEYFDKVAHNVNEMGLEVQKLSEAFSELEEYVENYFKNLNVQDEINNKLDEMAQNGSLTALINDYLQPYLNSFDSRLAQVENGTPLPANGISEMTNTQKLYCNIEDGYIYYYDLNTSTWKKGWEYMTRLIGKNQVIYDNLESNIQEKLNIIVPNVLWNNGAYRLKTTGAITNNVQFSYSDYIHLLKNQKIVFKSIGYNQAVSMITVFNEDKSRVINYVNSIDSTLKQYEFTANTDCYISLSGKTTNIDYYYIDNSDYIEYNKKIDVNNLSETIQNHINISQPSYNLNTGYYIESGTKIQSNNFAYTSPIFLEKGKTITAKLRGYSTNVSILSKCDENGENISNLIKSTNSDDVVINYTADSDMYVILCGNIRLSNISNVFIYKRLVTDDDIKNYTDFSSFINFGVIGDSLASGECVAKNGSKYEYVDNYDYSWGQFIARKHGMTCINFSKGGLNTRNWLNSPWGLQKLIKPENKCNSYIIALGVNDYSLGSDYIGTIDDININDYTLNADTFYGNYGKIISNIKNIQPKAKIFLFTIPEQLNTQSKYIQLNIAIRNIAEIFENVYVIDLANNYQDYYVSGFINSNGRMGHYNAISYNYMSDLLYKAISEYMHINYREFRQIEFIGTDYNYYN